MYLVYLHGYKWLKEKSAIVSDEKLSNLQKAIAFLDWKLWDEIWVENKNKGIELFVEYRNKRIKGTELLVESKKFGILDLIFLGSPYFDSIVLDSGIANCANCPILPLEMELIKKLKGEATSYKLNSTLMPKKGEKVNIVLKLK
jgi:hypothetical protein